MKKIKLFLSVLFVIAGLFISCSQEDVSKFGRNNEGKYSVTISSPITRTLTDQVQGAGRYPDGEKVSLYTSEQKFTAEAKGSSGGTWATTTPQIQATVTFGINQDWSVTIKDYYCDVTFDNRAMGGDGTVTTQALKFGELLPSPVTANEYIFEGWYDGDTKITIVPDCPKLTVTAKFENDAHFIVVGDDGYIVTPGKATKVRPNPKDYPSQAAFRWYNIGYGNGTYVAVGLDGYVTTSTDGINWETPKQIDKVSSFECIVYANGKFVVGGLTGGYVYTSTNGKNWTKTAKIAGVSDIKEIVYVNGKFVALGTFNSEGFILTSIDGVNWSVIASFPYGSYWDDLTYGDGKFVVVGSNMNTDRPYIRTSTDGVNWDVANSSFKGEFLMYENRKFIICGNGVYISDNAINWTRTFAQQKFWYAIAYNKGKFILVGEGGLFITSTDGMNWTSPKSLKDEFGKSISVILYGVCAME